MDAAQVSVVGEDDQDMATAAAEDEKVHNLGLLESAHELVSKGGQPPRETWAYAAKAVVVGTLNSLSDIALAVYGSSSSIPMHSEESFVDDGMGPVRHIPSCVRQPTSPPSVVAVIAEALPGIDIDSLACHAAATNLYGFWTCPSADCSHFIDVLSLRAHEFAFLRQFDIGRAASAVAASGKPRVISGNPTAARAALQLLAYQHYESAHLSRCGLEMVVSPTTRSSDGLHIVTWRWKPDWVELMPDIQAACADDERRLMRGLREWISGKGARVCDRLRRPYWVKVRLWARADRSERQRIVRDALDGGHSEYEAAFELFRACHLGDLCEADPDVREAYARGEELDRDVLHFTMLPARPWPREYPAWGSLSEKERQKIIDVYVSADHEARVKCERRVYNYPFLVPW
ncbi:unnamed protein product [Peniophora sp. CBMAI 1063]|nr:unnamed protein product [Peniophora sp. CBMAI 1063]